MANHSPFLKATRVHAAVALCIASCASAWAQQNPTEITITDKLPARVSGFGDVPAHELPFNTTTIDSATLKDIGAQRLSDALHLDASVTDSYNAPAYWDMLSVRGFTLNNRYNYQREGLPISAETMIPMDNKERIELLKGTSGMQAGTSAPGGLVNYVVKRAPTGVEQKIRNVTISYGDGNNRLVAADLGGRFGNTSEFGYRFNIAHEDLNPYIKNATGHRDLVALAMDFRINSDSKLEWEIEQSHREQIGVNAYSLLGTSDPSTAAFPSSVNPRLNFTYQPWTQPQVFDAFTSTIRFKQNLNNGWLWTTQVGTQHLRMDDRLSYAWGYDCHSITCVNWDRFSPQGNFDLWDYRSENERRKTEVIQTELTGTSSLSGFQHDLTFSVMRYRQLNRLPPMQAYNYAGTGNIDGTGTNTAVPTPYDLNTERSDYTNEFGVKDRIHLSKQTSAWLGLRHIQMNRQSTKTDGSVPVQDQRNVTTPWIAFSHSLDASMTVYASYGEGIETEVTPNKSSYTNRGQALPVLRSHQQEIGIKKQTLSSSWQITWFDITRPVSGCDPMATPCTKQIDGEAHHKGIELSGNTSVKNWNLGGGLTWIDAKRENSNLTPELNGQRPVNVPSYILRGMAEYRYTSVPGLRAGVRFSHEGERNVTGIGDIKLPAWTTLDATAHYDTKINDIASTWTLGINNVANKQYWRESPMQDGHFYLYPGAPRTLRASVQFRL
ncbi:TonB-dependent siderophore receptor [Limnohabitans sp. INBF002]|uniref:TonB-dependent siderophore receptor n=1 Tax=Limnohabitans sp. INBF002 TaxID=2986280 RepID=UPI00237796DE|nr:TonB-dependent siderophore receptor [Limnohabitans sp. INBF002]BDU53299.1 TonB-dependent receptor [Limnohabitans sp. INBF002]